MRIISLTINNVMRLSAVHIEPDGNVVVVSGRNEQGKTCVLNSIMMALGGAKCIPDKPIRDGKKKAEITLDLGELKVVRTFKRGGGGGLVVTDADGVEKTSPQARLTKIYSKLAFDPLEFARKDAKIQAEIVMQLADINLDELNTERAKIYENRKDLNKEVKSLMAQIDAIPRDSDAPTEETSVTELLAELDTAEAAAKAMSEASTSLTNAGEAHEDLTTEIAELSAQLEGLKDAEKLAAGDEEKAKRSMDLLPVPPDVDEIKGRMEALEGDNARAREQAKRKHLREVIEKVESDAEDCTSRIDAIDEEKMDTIQKAKLPLPGLGFDDDGLTVDGIPFSQGSSAQILKVSLAMGLALNPELKVILIREGSLLDNESMATVAAMAKEANAQVWIERVGDGGDGAIVIEDGRVLEVDFEDVTNRKQIGDGKAEVNGS